MMKRIKKSIVYWRQFLPLVLRWFILLALAIGYIAVAISFDPLTALFGVIAGTGLFAAAIVLFAFPFWLANQGLSLLLSRRWWLGLLLLAADYAYVITMLSCNVTAFALYLTVGLGWFFIFGALYLYAPPIWWGEQ